VSTCDTSIDYFPYKIDSTFARSFDLEYYNYYKILTLHVRVPFERLSPHALPVALARLKHWGFV
jgi:hypothetical protein